MVVAALSLGFLNPFAEPKIAPTAIPKPPTHTRFLGAVPSTPGGAPKSSASADELKATLQAVLDKHSAFWNVSISIALHNSSLELAVASGVDDYGSGAPLTPQHRIPMGSTTKAYSAVGTMRLVEQGVLASLDVPVAPYVDRFLQTPHPCKEMSGFCKDTCVPAAPCFFDPTRPNCSAVAAVGDACLGYCAHYLHCAALPLPPLTLRRLWGNESAIEAVTFRQILGMTSGVMDYYDDPGNWLYWSVMNSSRDVEPLEYLHHQNHSFLFAPGTAGRGSYSTNGFSLVGLALCGLLNLSDWSQLDQRALAWGDQLYPDDATGFGTRGPCSSYPHVAKQYASLYPVAVPFEEISGHSCLNSWLGGNIAARPLDVARFWHAVFASLNATATPSFNASHDVAQPAAPVAPRLLSATSLAEMTDLHELSDGFAAGVLAYGLGMEALWNGGKPGTMQTCGLGWYGHGGLDYGSGAPVSGYFPELRLGVTIALTSSMSYGSAVTGKNCSLSYASLPKAQDDVANDVLAHLSAAAGLVPKCSSPSYAPPDPAHCGDAPYFGKMNGALPGVKKQVTCAQILASAAGTTHQTERALCGSWLGHTTIGTVKQQLAKEGYEPPPGYADSALAVTLCNATCGTLGEGPCWLEAKQTPWCPGDAPPPHRGWTVGFDVGFALACAASAVLALLVPIYLLVRCSRRRRACRAAQLGQQALWQQSSPTVAILPADSMAINNQEQ